MDHTLLVVDDSFAERRDDYLILCERVNQSDASLNLAFDFLTEPSELIPKIHSIQYTGVILDAVLNENWPGFTLPRALTDIGDIPFLLLSGQWNRSNSEYMEIGWRRSNFHGFMHWRDISSTNAENVEGDLQYAISQVQRLVYSVQGLLPTLKVGSDDPLHMLHVSDLQFGGTDTRDLASETENAASVVLQRFAGPPHFVAITGDIAERGLPAEYSQATVWLRGFLNRLGLDSSEGGRVLLVPGNHDVTIPLAASSRIKLQKKKDAEGEYEVVFGANEEFPELRRYARMSYEGFRSQFSDLAFLGGEAHSESLGWVECRFRHLGIMFYGVNTAMPVSPYGFPERSVDPQILVEIRTNLRPFLVGAFADQPVIIGLSHHSPLAADGDEPVSNTESFLSHFNNQIRTHVFLHGHAHKRAIRYEANDDFRLIRVCSQTWGKENRPKDTLRGFNLLTMKRAGGIVRKCDIWSYGWNQGRLLELDKKAFVRRSDGMFQEERVP